MTYPILFLLRHGQTKWNAEGRFQGQKNSDLTEQGRKDAISQGKLLKEVFAKHPGIGIYVSPLSRARITAKIALADHNRTPTIAKDLIEINAGDWEGLTKSDIAADWPNLFEACKTKLELFMNAPNGEGFETLNHRCCRFLNDLTSSAVVFSHGATIAVLRGIACGLSYAEILQLDHKQGCIYRIENGQEKILTME